MRLIKIIFIFLITVIINADDGYYSIIDLDRIGSNIFTINNNKQVVYYAYNSSTKKSELTFYNNGQKTNIGSLGGTKQYDNTVAYAMNNFGQIVGNSYLSNNSTIHAFLWQNGQMTDLGAFGGPYSYAYDINDNGQIVGNASLSSSETHAFLWQNGQMIDLGTLGGKVSTAKAINNSGQIAGYSYLSNNQTYHVFLWQNGQMTDLGSLDYQNIDVKDINNNGVIIGNGNTLTVASHGFIYYRGQMINLTTLISGAFSTEVIAINSQNQVIFNAKNSSGNSYHSYMWQNGAITDLTPNINSQYCYARSISNQGVVFLDINIDYTRVGYVWENGILNKFNIKIPVGSTWTNFSSPTKINDSGIMVGSGYKSINNCYCGYILSKTDYQPKGAIFNSEKNQIFSPKRIEAEYISNLSQKQFSDEYSGKNSVVLKNNSFIQYTVPFKTGNYNFSIRYKTTPRTANGEFIVSINNVEKNRIKIASNMEYLFTRKITNMTINQSDVLKITFSGHADSECIVDYIEFFQKSADASPITISSGNLNLLKSGDNFIIEIPSTISATFDTSLTQPFFVGNAIQKINSVVSYITNKQIMFTVTGDFVEGDYVKISGLRFLLEDVGSVPERLKMYINYFENPILDDKIIFTSIPFINFTSVSLIPEQSTSIPQITIGDSMPGDITKEDGLKLVIPDYVPAVWDNTVNEITLSGTAKDRVNETVTYSDNKKELILNIKENLFFGDSIIISGLKAISSTSCTFDSLMLKNLKSRQLASKINSDVVITPSIPTTTFSLPTDPKQLKVSFSSNKPVSLFYTLDGSTPSESSAVYYDPITLTANSADIPVSSVLVKKVTMLPILENGVSAATKFNGYGYRKLFVFPGDYLNVNGTRGFARINLGNNNFFAYSFTNTNSIFKTGYYNKSLVSKTFPSTHIDQKNPAAVNLTNGNFVLVYECQDSDSSGIGVQMLNSFGNPVGAPFYANTTLTGSQTMPRCTWLNNGGFLIVWVYNNRVWGQRFNADGTKAGGEFSIDWSGIVPNYIYQLRTDTFSDGSYVVTNSYSYNSMSYIYIQKFSSDNIQLNRIGYYYSNTYFDFFNECILDNNNIVICYTRASGTNLNYYQLYFYLYDSNLNLIKNVSLYDTYPYQYETLSGVCFSKGDGFFVYIAETNRGYNLSNYYCIKSYDRNGSYLSNFTVTYNLNYQFLGLNDGGFIAFDRNNVGQRYNSSWQEVYIDGSN